MKRSIKELLNLKTIANLPSIDANNWLEHATQLEEQGLTKELRNDHGNLAVLQLKKLR